MRRSERLTEQERTFAEQNHDLVYAFLNQNHLQESEFYDVVAWGYLRAVQRYHREPQLKKYSFSTIAWNAMRCYVGNKRKSDKIRNAMIAFSINELTEEGTECGEFIRSAKDAFWELEQQENLEELLSKIMPMLTESQKDHIIAALEGYKPCEIMQKEHISVQHYQKDRKVIQAAVAEVLPAFSGGGGVLNIWLFKRIEMPWTGLYTLLRHWRALIYKNKMEVLAR